MLSGTGINSVLVKTIRKTLLPSSEIESKLFHVKNLVKVDRNVLIKNTEGG